MNSIYIRVGLYVRLHNIISSKRIYQLYKDYEYELIKPNLIWSSEYDMWYEFAKAIWNNNFLYDFGATKNVGSAEIWTRIAGFRVLSANRYTTEPFTLNWNYTYMLCFGRGTTRQFGWKWYDLASKCWYGIVISPDKHNCILLTSLQTGHFLR